MDERLKMASLKVIDRIDLIDRFIVRHGRELDDQIYYSIKKNLEDLITYMEGIEIEKTTKELPTNVCKAFEAVRED